LVKQYLYTGELIETVGMNLLPLLRAASIYDVTELVGMCGDIIGKTLSEHNMLMIYQNAVKYGDAGLKELSLKYICG